MNAEALEALIFSDLSALSRRVASLIFRVARHGETVILSHTDLGHLLTQKRSNVSIAVKDLVIRGILTRVARGRYVVCVDPKLWTSIPSVPRNAGVSPLREINGIPRDNCEVVSGETGAMPEDISDSCEFAHARELNSIQFNSLNSMRRVASNSRLRTLALAHMAHAREAGATRDRESTHGGGNSPDDATRRAIQAQTSDGTDDATRRVALDEVSQQKPQTHEGNFPTQGRSEFGHEARPGATPPTTANGGLVAPPTSNRTGSHDGRLAEPRGGRGAMDTTLPGPEKPDMDAIERACMLVERFFPESEQVAQQIRDHRRVFPSAWFSTAVRRIKAKGVVPRSGNYWTYLRGIMYEWQRSGGPDVGAENDYDEEMNLKPAHERKASKLVRRGGASFGAPDNSPKPPKTFRATPEERERMARKYAAQRVASSPVELSDADRERLAKLMGRSVDGKDAT